MFKKLKYHIKRFLNCVEAPNRSETFEEWTWLEICKILDKGYLNSKTVVLYFKYHEVFNSLDLYYYNYWGKNSKRVLSKEVLEYTLSYIEDKIKKNKSLTIEKSKEYVIIKNINNDWR